MELEIVIPLVIGFVIVSGILAFILKTVLSSQSNTAIEKIKRLNQENLQREMELKKKLEEAEQLYQKRITEASEESIRIKEKMEQEILDIRNKVLTAAEREKEDILSDAREEIDDLKRNLFRSVNTKALDITEQIINKFFSGLDGNEKVLTELHSHLIDEALKQIKSIKKETLSSALAESKEIEVSSELTITPYQKQIITQIFSEIAAKPIKIVEKTSPVKSLAGISIRLGNLVIDATLKNNIQQILSKLPTNISNKENQNIT
ncbi:MAG: F0F1 ATP synthase subunit delta [Planctomycetota bacterium]